MSDNMPKLFQEFSMGLGSAAGGTSSTAMNSITLNGNNSSGGSGGGSGSSNPGKMPQIIRDFLGSLDDEEWKNELYKLLQGQSFNQVEVDLFELLCKVLDQNLFAQVDWARNSFYFRELEVSKILGSFSFLSLFLFFGGYFMSERVSLVLHLVLTGRNFQTAKNTSFRRPSFLPKIRQYNYDCTFNAAHFSTYYLYITQ